MRSLHPTIWRTCRVLANPVRLALLRTLIQSDPVCVTELARLCRVPVPSATAGLRALQARGLLHARRRGLFVFYEARPDPEVAHAARLLAAVRAAFGRRAELPDILAAMTAYTHARRIAIVRTLAAGPLTLDAMAVRCRISPSALRRHVAKLRRRGLLEVSEEGLCSLARPASRLARDMLDTVLSA